MDDLPAPFAPHEGDDLPRADLQRDAPHGPDRAVRDHEVDDLQHVAASG
jgi:hypothetical protein